MSWTGAINTPTYQIDNEPLLYGNLTLISGMSITGGSGIGFADGAYTTTITTNGKTIPNLLRIGQAASGGPTVNLADNLTITGPLIVNYQVTFNTNNYNINVTYVSWRGTVNLGSSTITLTGHSSTNGKIWSISSGDTFNAGTSSIVINKVTATANYFTGGGKTYNNLTVQGIANAFTLSIFDANTFNNLVLQGEPYATGHTIKFESSVTQTISSFTATGYLSKPLKIQSTSVGTQHTLSMAGGESICDYLDIKDSNATGGATWLAGPNSISSGNTDGWIFKTLSFFLLFQS